MKAVKAPKRVIANEVGQAFYEFSNDSVLDNVGMGVYVGMGRGGVLYLYSML